jgi:hypothetical protein
MKLLLKRYGAQRGACWSFWSVVDPGHVPMIAYLKRLERKLREQANELESRCNRESGGT